MAQTERLFPGKLRVNRRDLTRAGVGSDWTINKLIKEGKIRPPHKEGTEVQSRVFWWADEIEEDLARMRLASAAADKRSAAA